VLSNSNTLNLINDIEVKKNSVLATRFQASDGTWSRRHM